MLRCGPHAARLLGVRQHRGLVSLDCSQELDVLSIKLTIAVVAYFVDGPRRNVFRVDVPLDDLLLIRVGRLLGRSEIVIPAFNYWCQRFSDVLQVKNLRHYLGENALVLVVERDFRPIEARWSFFIAREFFLRRRSGTSL